MASIKPKLESRNRKSAVRVNLPEIGEIIIGDKPVESKLLTFDINE
jgi:hypothetical protein